MRSSVPVIFLFFYLIGIFPLGEPAQAQMGMGGGGAVAFAGMAFTSEDFGTMAMNELLPGAGFGLRFQMIEAYRINARIDVAWGEDDSGIYIGIGKVY